jgi:uncharacterized protein YbaA (DUF1428 family)
MSKSDVNRGSYSHIFIYRIPGGNHEAMVKLQKQLTQLYRKHGTLSSEFYQLGATNVFNGFTSLDKAIGAQSGEEVWVEVDMYQNARQFRTVVEAVGGDEKGELLFGQLYGLISQGYSTIMGEFTRLEV